MTLSDPPEASLPLLEHVRKVFEFNRTSFLGHLTGIVVVEVIFAGAAPAALLVGWGGVFAALWLLRVWLALRFERNAPRTAQGLRSSLRAWQLGVLATGALWGAGAWLFLPYGGLMRELSLVLIVFTFCIASVPIIGAQFGLFTGFVLLVLVPTISRFVLRGDTVDLEFACVLSAAMGMTMFSGHNRRRAEKIAVRLVAEKAAADAARRQATERAHDIELQYERISALERAGAVAEERGRLMLDMHDGLGSQLMATLNALERGKFSTEDVADLLRRCIEDLRLVIDSLDAGEHNLAASLANLRYRVEPRLNAAGLILGWAVDPQAGCRLAPSAVLHVLRVVQEALTNALKHAQATRLDVRVSEEASTGTISIEVTDNGRGLLPLTTEGHTGTGRGLANMRQRARSLGGDLETVAYQGGTCVRLHIPSAPRL